MNKDFLRSISDRLQRERRTLIDEMSRQEERSRLLAGDIQPELEEQAQTEISSGITEGLEERQQDRLGNIDKALARIEAGNYGRCQNCGRSIAKERLDADPTTTFCEQCAVQEEKTSEEGIGSDRPESGPLPPDLEQLDDQELQEHLRELVREDGQVDMQEIEIIAGNGVVYLEGAIPSEPEHAILIKILTDVAGVQEIVDHLEIQRLAWEREDRSKKPKQEKVPDVLPGTVPNQEPYGGTEDVVLTEEEGVNYEPPENPPAPPHRKD